VSRVIVTDPNSCGGCRLCEAVCAWFRWGVFNPKKSAIRIVRMEPGIDIPVVCRQCHDPPCAKPCPVGAIYKNEKTGVVIVDEEKCIGCGDCVGACPLGAIVVHPREGIAIKCNLCEGDPQCVKYCFKGALEFSDGELKSKKIRREWAKKQASAILKKQGLSLL
jgi:carbon-monoxide dehydrogenase iron sulfur subunit